MAKNKDLVMAEGWLTGLLYMALIGILFLVVYGNLSGNLGFAVGTQGANDTNAVIGNATGGILTFFSFSNTFFNLVAVTLLIVIILGVIKRFRGSSGGGNFN